MKKILILAGGLMAAAVHAAPEALVTKAASGSTAATVYFEPGSRPAVVRVADVTSDKAASVLSWRVGTNQLTLLAPLASAADSTNLVTTIGLVASNAALVSVRADGTVTAHNAFTNSFITNALITFDNPIGTNVVVASSAVNEVTGSYFDISAASGATITVASNATIHTTIGVDTNLLLTASPNQLTVGTVVSWVTNGADYVVTLAGAPAFVPLKAHILTNTYSISFAAPGAGYDLVLTNSTFIAAGDNLLLTNGTGGITLRKVQSVAAYRYQLTPLKAATGLDLAAGDRLFVLDTAVTTPVGAATLRLMSDVVRVLPANVPGVLSVDGTSACTINAAVLDYGR